MKEDKRGLFLQEKEKVRFPLAEPRESAGQTEESDSHFKNLIRSPGQFPVRAHPWIVGQVPRWGYTRGNHTLMFLSLSFFLPFSKNK